MNTRRFRNRSQAFLQMRWLGWVMLMMFVLVQTVAAAEASAQFDPETRQVVVQAAAPAATWDSIAQMGRHSLVVYEDNIRRPVEDVEVSHTQLSLGVLLEDGGRYHALNEALAENVSRAVRDLKEGLGPDDRIAMWTYSATVEPLGSADEGASGVQRTDLTLPVPPSSETNFYDALLTTLPRVEAMPGRKALLVVSSGIDTFSKAGISDVLRAERAAGVPVCVIDLGPLLRSTLLDESSDGQWPYAHLQWQQASSNLARIASVSGCRALKPDSSLEFPAAYDGLLANLRLQYVIRYPSSALKLPGTRQVRIVWSAGTDERSGPAQNSVRHDRELARARYDVDAGTVLAGAEGSGTPCHSALCSR